MRPPDEAQHLLIDHLDALRDAVRGRAGGAAADRAGVDREEVLAVREPLDLLWRDLRRPLLPRRRQRLVPRVTTPRSAARPVACGCVPHADPRGRIAGRRLRENPVEGELRAHYLHDLDPEHVALWMAECLRLQVVAVRCPQLRAFVGDHFDGRRRAIAFSRNDGICAPYVAAGSTASRATLCGGGGRVDAATATGGAGGKGRHALLCLDATDLVCAVDTHADRVDLRLVTPLLLHLPLLTAASLCRRRARPLMVGFCMHRDVASNRCTWRFAALQDRTGDLGIAQRTNGEFGARLRRQDGRDRAPIPSLACAISHRRKMHANGAPAVAALGIPEPCHPDAVTTCRTTLFDDVVLGRFRHRATGARVCTDPRTRAPDLNLHEQEFDRRRKQVHHRTSFSPVSPSVWFSFPHAQNTHNIRL